MAETSWDSLASPTSRVEIAGGVDNIRQFSNIESKDGAERVLVMS